MSDSISAYGVTNGQVPYQLGTQIFKYNVRKYDYTDEKFTYITFMVKDDDKYLLRDGTLTSMTVYELILCHPDGRGSSMVK